MNCGLHKAEMCECELFLEMTKSAATPSGPDAKREEAQGAEPLTVSSESLLAGRRQLIIQHGGERYRLLLTSSNKLILTK
jgi:hemin uptake protein HemP